MSQLPEDREQDPEQEPEHRDPDEPAHDSRRGLHPVILVICILVFVFLFFLVREVRTEYVGRYGSQGAGPQESVSQVMPHELWSPELGAGVTSARG